MFARILQAGRRKSLDHLLIRQRLPHGPFFSWLAPACRSLSSQGASARRRRRKAFGRDFQEHSTSNPAKKKQIPRFGNLDEPFDHGEASMDDYLKKVSLSPWVPVSDSTARKLMDMAQAGPDDVHVDLGSGDGRVNFTAIDYCHVQRSIGVDIDEKIVQVARDRLAKRHPAPNVEFIVADLLDSNINSEVWDKIQEATIITMYFATEGLRLFRPILEQKLIGRKCKILTVGYEMPGWESHVQEVVLGTQIHLYYWGIPSPYEDDGFDLDMPLLGDDILNPEDKPKELTQNALEGERFNGVKVIDRTGMYGDRGFNPNIFNEEEDEYDSDQDDEPTSQGATTGNNGSQDPPKRVS